MSWFDSKFWNFFLGRKLIWVKIFWKLFESWVDPKSNFRKPLLVVNWFESILAKQLWVMGWVDSKLSETKLNRIKNESYPRLATSHIMFHHNKIRLDVIHWKSLYLKLITKEPASVAELLWLFWCLNLIVWSHSQGMVPCMQRNLPLAWKAKITLHYKRCRIQKGKERMA